MRNVVYLEGNLTRPVHEVPTGNSTPMAFLRLGADREYTTASGATRRETAYPSIVCFGANALYAQRHGMKGRAIAVEGSLRTRKVDDRGQPRYILEVVADPDGLRIFEGTIVSSDGAGLIPATGPPVSSTSLAPRSHCAAAPYQLPPLQMAADHTPDGGQGAAEP